MGAPPQERVLTEGKWAALTPGTSERALNTVIEPIV
ncbi:hypothetical protein JOJ86_000551 [Rhodococcus percolatus]|nr:hypothetical protein [Rhodococcus opacus]MBP2202825.1 hypothetical protein [Rhodococcus opacus]CAG7587502.1 hypothetical protein E143388_02683 [Rhodococcus opacus]